MLRHRLNQQQISLLISAITSEYEDSVFHNDDQLKLTLDHLIDLCLHAPGTQTMELLDIIINGVEQALIESELTPLSETIQQTSLHG